MCVDHKVGTVFQVYRKFSFVFAFPYEIKQPLGSTETQCIRMHNTWSSKSSKTFISQMSLSVCWPDLTLFLLEEQVICQSNSELSLWNTGFLLCSYLKAIYFYCCPHLKYFRLMKQCDCFYLQSVSFLLKNIIQKNANLNLSGYLCWAGFKKRISLVKNWQIHAEHFVRIADCEVLLNCTFSKHVQK